jgi:hypothetical protein
VIGSLPRRIVVVERKDIPGGIPEAHKLVYSETACDACCCCAWVCFIPGHL